MQESRAAAAFAFVVLCSIAALPIISQLHAVPSHERQTLVNPVLGLVLVVQ